MTRTVQRGWLWTCECGTEAVMRNAAPALIFSDKPCRHCKANDLTEERADGRVAAEMGWCGCGSPWDIDRMMTIYLSEADSPWNYSQPEQVWTLLAYIADGLGWTDHGGSIRCAWLTDAGKEALANLTAVAEA